MLWALNCNGSKLSSNKHGKGGCPSSSKWRTAICWILRMVQSMQCRAAGSKPLNTSMMKVKRKKRQGIKVAVTLDKHVQYTQQQIFTRFPSLLDYLIYTDNIPCAPTPYPGIGHFLSLFLSLSVSLFPSLDTNQRMGWQPYLYCSCPLIFLTCREVKKKRDLMQTEAGLGQAR